MATEIATHIELRTNRDGQSRAYIAGTRVRVQDIYAYAEILGMSSDAIVEQLPQLTLGQVHAALSYFFDHRQQILDEIRQDEEFANLVRVQTGPGPLAQRLSADAHGNSVSS